MDSDIAFIAKDESYNILSTKFGKVLSIVNPEINRNSFIAFLKANGLLIHNRQSNMINRTNPFNKKQDRYICIRLIQKDEKSNTIIDTWEEKVCQSVDTEETNNLVIEQDIEQTNNVVIEQDIEETESKNDLISNKKSETELREFIPYWDKVTFYAYFGGKNRKIGDKLQYMIPEDIEEYHELFGGSGAVLMNLQNRKCKKHINDLDRYVVNLYSVVKCKEKCRQLLRMFETLRYDKEEFINALGIYHELETKRKTGQKDFYPYTDVEVAYMEYVLITQSFNSCRKTYADNKWISNSQYRKRTRERINDASLILQDVEVTNENTLDILERVTGDERVFIYLDPPYLEELMTSRNVYRCCLSIEEQKRMLIAIRDSKCRIMISGYKNEDEKKDLYSQYLTADYGWHCLLVAEENKSSSRSGVKAYEYIWYNYDTPKVARMFIPIPPEVGKKEGGRNE